MASRQCISCNSPILETANLCKCGHVNEAMRTIAGKRFSGYREELYTRRVIKESRDEYLKMRRESRGIKRRLRKPLQNRQALQHETLDHVIASKQDDIIDVKLAEGLVLRPESGTSNYAKNHLSNGNTHENSTTGYNLMPINTENHVTHDVLVAKKRRQHTGRRGVKEHRTSIPNTPMYQFSMEGPLAEINKRLINQRTFWMCLV